MPERPPPARSAAGSDIGPEASQAVARRGIRLMGRRTNTLVAAIDLLLHRIDAVWDETPETLAMLAEWADTLQAQKRDLEDWQRSVGYRPVRELRIRRAVRQVALDLALMFRLGRRLRQLAIHGERLRAGQADAAARTEDAVHRAMLDRHLARTERHLARLRERLHPGR